MKNTNNIFYKRLKIFTIIITMAFAVGLSARDDFDDDVDDTGAAAPIDGGISILLAAGAIYGVRKLRKNKH